jgi:CBS domain containing-hemolysin-like protein
MFVDLLFSKSFMMKKCPFLFFMSYVIAEKNGAFAFYLSLSLSLCLLQVGERTERQDTSEERFSKREREEEERFSNNEGTCFLEVLDLQSRFSMLFSLYFGKSDHDCVDLWAWH